jgi:hypothetical protein
MGLHLHGVVHHPALPQLNLGSIEKKVLDEGKKLLGEVIRDAFTAAQEPGAVPGNPSGLPHPAGALAHKLPGSAGHARPDGEVHVPSLKHRLRSHTAHRGAHHTHPHAHHAPHHVQPHPAAPSGSQGVGSGGSVGSNAVTGSSGSSTGSSGGQNALLTALNAASDAQNNALNEFNNLGDIHAPDYQKKLEKAQMDMQAAEQAMQMLSQIMEMMHQTSMAIIGNIR